MNNYKILCAGSRTFTNYNLILNELNKYSNKKRVLVIEGGARGADKLSKKAAIKLNYDVMEVLAEWDLYGKKAGFIRNIKMLNLNPDLVLIFSNDINNSRGSYHTYSNAIKRGLNVKLVSE